ncbi:MAG: septation protein A [Pseudomonadota bacterium]
MKLIYEFLPIALFFGIYKYTGDIYHATLAIIIATILQVSFEWFKFHKVEKSRLIGLVLVVVLGGATILFHDDTFIKWKVSVINWLFAAILIGSQFIGNKTIIERMMGSAMELPKPIWLRLNTYWALFFFISGLLNVYFAFFYGLDLTIEERTDVWVNFKFYGLFGLTIVFMILQVLFIHKHIQINEETTNEKEEV